MNVAIIYDSKTGTTEKAGEYIAEGLNSVGVQAKCFHINNSECEEYVKTADGVILGSPTYMATVTADMMNWLQTTAKRMKPNLAHKLGGAYATEQYIHGCAENVITNLLFNEMVYGMMVYSGGGSYGKPVIHIGPVGMSQNIESFKDLFVTYGTRFGEQLKLVGKK